MLLLGTLGQQELCVARVCMWVRVCVSVVGEGVCGRCGGKCGRWVGIREGVRMGMCNHLWPSNKTIESSPCLGIHVSHHQMESNLRSHDFPLNAILRIT